MPIHYVDMITREMVQSDRDAIFVFGDNVERFGLGGQAGAMRGEPNTIGVATKRAPGMADADFFSDCAADRDALLADIKLVADKIDEGYDVYVATAGLGTGLSELPTRAPKLAQIIVDRFRGFSGEKCPWPDVIGTDPRGIIAYKGFDKDLRCRDFQYEIGQTYTMDGEIEACLRGFHACSYPLGVFDHYPPTSRLAEVTLSGDMDREGGRDTKIAAGSITITGEFRLPEFIARAVKWVIDRAIPEGETATGDRGAASATGDRGAASATGYRGAASATGDRGAASATGDSGAASATGYSGATSATGDRGAASATGDRGAASATGYSGAASATGYRGAASATGDRGAASATGDRGAASATGDRGAAMASGRNGRAMGRDGCALFLVHRDAKWNIIHAWAGIVGRDGIKPDTWYTLDANGNPTEVSTDD